MIALLQDFDDVVVLRSGSSIENLFAPAVSSCSAEQTMLIDRGATEPMLPERVADDDDRMSSRRIVVFWQEQTTDGRTNPKHREQVWRDDTRADALGRLTPAHVDLLRRLIGGDARNAWLPSATVCASDHIPPPPSADMHLAGVGLHEDSTDRGRVGHTRRSTQKQRAAVSQDDAVYRSGRVSDGRDRASVARPAADRRECHRVFPAEEAALT